MQQPYKTVMMLVLFSCSMMSANHTSLSTTFLGLIKQIPGQVKEYGSFCFTQGSKFVGSSIRYAYELCLGQDIAKSPYADHINRFALIIQGRAPIGIKVLEHKVSVAGEELQPFFVKDFMQRYFVITPFGIWINEHKIARRPEAEQIFLCAYIAALNNPDYYMMRLVYRGIIVAGFFASWLGILHWSSYTTARLLLTGIPIYILLSTFDKRVCKELLVRIEKKYAEKGLSKAATALCNNGYAWVVEEMIDIMVQVPPYEQKTLWFDGPISVEQAQLCIKEVWNNWNKGRHTE